MSRPPQPPVPGDDADQGASYREDRDGRGAGEGYRGGAGSGCHAGRTAQRPGGYGR